MDTTTRFRSYPQMGTVKRTAEVFGVSASYIRRLCKAGKVAYVNTGHSWLVNMDGVARYFEHGDPGPAGQDEAVNGVRRVVR